MNLTGIEWTRFSANPLKYRDAAGRVVWSCVHKSGGCLHCYSEVLAKRYGRGGPFTAQAMKGLTPFLDDAELHHMATAKRIGGLEVSGSLCFVGDMTDLFGEWVSDDLLNRLFSEVLERRQDVIWQLLTKRADRLHSYLAWRWGEGRIPSRNIHIGVSIEDQATADERIPLLLQTPAAVRFVSYEPALGPVDFRPWLRCRCEACQNRLGQVALYHEEGQNGTEESFDVVRPPDGPRSHWLPLAADAPASVMVPSDVAAHCRLEPRDDGRASVVDRDPGSGRPVHAAPHPEVPLTIEHPGDVSELAGAPGHTNRFAEPRRYDDKWVGAWRIGQPASGFMSSTAAKLCPYGAPGDRLWLRETFRQAPGSISVHYAADPDEVSGGPWRSPIFMPRWASRVTLEVTAVRVERLQEISERDCVAEGVAEWCSCTCHAETSVQTCEDCGSRHGRDGFRAGWDSINGKCAPWASNPFVWAISFRRL